MKKLLVKFNRIYCMVTVIIISLIAMACSRHNGPSGYDLPVAATDIDTSHPDYRNFYGISWRGLPHDNLAFARQMKYSYVFYQKGMETDSLSNDLYFYLESPEYITYNRRIETKKTYSAQEKLLFETRYALKSASKPFPYNIATGWFFNDTAFTPILDYQQQTIITYVIDSIIKYAQLIESRNPRFHFGGLAWDVPQPAGDFWDTLQPPGKQVTLKFWTGGDYGITHPSVTHQFSTYSEAHIQFYKQLYSRVRQLYPSARFIMEPYKIYDEWINTIKDRPDANEIMPDMLCQESAGTEFVSDTRIFAGGLITKDRVSSTTPNVYGESANRVIAAQAAINGSWFSWFGRFGGTGDMPNYQSIKEVSPRLKLIRLLPNYENLNNTPLNQRTWDGTYYISNTSYAGPKSIGIMQPITSKFFVVLMTADAEVPVPAGKAVISISKTNTLLQEIGDGSADIIISGGKIRLNGTAGMNAAYVIKCTSL